MSVRSVFWPSPDDGPRHDARAAKAEHSESGIPAAGHEARNAAEDREADREPCKEFCKATVGGDSARGHRGACLGSDRMWKCCCGLLWGCWVRYGGSAGLLSPGPGAWLLGGEGGWGGFPLLVEVGVVADGSAASGALLLPVGGLISFLRDHCLDATSAQVGLVAAGRVGPVPSDRARPGAGRPTGPRTRIVPSTGMRMASP